MNDNIDFSAPLDDILERKAEYHRLQIQMHKMELEKISALRGKEHKQALPNLISSNAESVIKPNTHVAQPKAKGKTKGKRPPIMAQKVVYPFIIKYFETHTGKHNTVEVFDYISTVKDTTKEARSSWVTAISLCLRTMSMGKTPKLTVSDSDKGSAKLYEWIAE